MGVRGYTLEQILEPVKAEFEAFRALLEEVSISEQPFMRPITQDVLRSGGKQMRPLLTLLTARLHGSVTPQTLASAVLIEMIHWSTLVHDDVIDEAYLRRDQWTPNALLRSKSAVLIGDYLFSKGLSQAAQAGCYATIGSATRTIEQIVNGELMQMEHSRRLETTEAIYAEIIRLKTGALLASAAECGVLSLSGATTEEAQRMHRFGEALGLAFQIKDDLLDYGFTTGGQPTGKVWCNDLREGKMTLPLIHALEQSNTPNQREARHHLRKARDVKGLGGSIGWLRDFVQSHGGIAYALSVMENHRNTALQILAGYPDSPTREALERYADYVVGREY